ncbi:MAG: PqqD family protein [Calditrichota bacterium]
MNHKNKPDRQKIIAEWLSLYPVRQIDFEIDDNSNAVLIIPHPENWFTRRFLPKPKTPAQRIHLDEIGTFIWQLFDGKSDISTICTQLKEKYGENLKQAEERTVLFTQQMYKQEFIKVYSRKDEIK